MITMNPTEDGPRKKNISLEDALSSPARLLHTRCHLVTKKLHQN